MAKLGNIWRLWKRLWLFLHETITMKITPKFKSCLLLFYICYKNQKCWIQSGSSSYQKASSIKFLTTSYTLITGFSFHSANLLNQIYTFWFQGCSGQIFQKIVLEAKNYWESLTSTSSLRGEDVLQLWPLYNFAPLHLCNMHSAICVVQCAKRNVHSAMCIVHVHSAMIIVQCA